MAWIAIGAAAITAGAAIYSGNQAGNASRDAANTQANAANNTAALTDAAQRRLEARMQPYINTGNAADYFVNGMLGLPVGAGPGGAGGQPGAIDWQSYYDQYIADEFDQGTSEWARQARSQTDGSPEAVARHHYQQWGQRLGNALPRVPATPGTPEANTEAARSSAMAAYEASPWAQFARESAAEAERDGNMRTLSAAGARGAITSGRTARGLYEVSQRAEDQRFREGFTQGWMPAISGVSDRGYNASVGVGNSSLSSAAAAGAAGERGAAAVANGQRESADAMASGINSALYYAGQAVDAWTNRKPSGGSSPTTGKKTTTYGAEKYYGG